MQPIGDKFRAWPPLMVSLNSMFKRDVLKLILLEAAINFVSVVFPRSQISVLFGKRHLSNIYFLIMFVATQSLTPYYIGFDDERPGSLVVNTAARCCTTDGSLRQLPNKMPTQDSATTCDPSATTFCPRCRHVPEADRPGPQQTREQVPFVGGSFFSHVAAA